jgi:hypothetical protein
MSGVSQAIKVDEALDFGPVDNLLDHIGANKAGSSGNKEFHSQ